MTSETAVQRLARLKHIELTRGQNWRNNTGVLKDERGTPVRYGLANESKDQNKIIKSSDIIGVTPTLITQEMVGYWLGVFTAMEIKPSGWRMPTPIAGREFKDQPEATQRALAQLKFHDIVRSACGYAGFVTDPATDIPRIIRRG